MSRPRPCERKCRTCGYWKHHSRFHNWRSKGSLATKFAADCLDCETTARNEEKNKDRALWIIKQRTQDHAKKHGLTTEFMWVNMNWRSLVPMMRAMMTEEALCTSCGHAFDSEPDIQLEHRDPPRHLKDYARLHARNIGLACASCNGKKSKTPYAVWLDREEAARLSNEVDRSSWANQPDYGPLFEPR